VREVLAEKVLLALPVSDIVVAPMDHAAHNDNFSFEVHAAVLLAEDNESLNIVVDRWAMAQEHKQSFDPIYPSRFYADPNHDPNDHPNVAAKQNSTQRKSWGVLDSNAQEFVVRTKAHPLDLQTTTVRYTKNSHTSYPLEKPNISHRKKNNSNLFVAHNKQDNQAQQRDLDIPAR
jgi:hypothetical protein